MGSPPIEVFFRILASAPQSDLTSLVQIRPLPAQRLSTCALQIGDEGTPHLQALSITLLLQTPMAVSVTVALVSQHAILDHGLMTATVI